MSFFDTPFTFNSITTSEAISQHSRFTKLPVEIQLEVRDKMSIYEADEAVRRTFPRLIPRWIPTVPNRFERLRNLTSPENMGLLGYANAEPSYSSGRATPVAIYRLRSIDQHPNIEIGPSTSISPQSNPDHSNDLLRDAQKNAMLSSVALFNHFREAAGKLDSISKMKEILLAPASHGSNVPNV
ncbi:hypothetical protein DL98DRAFT_587927 [Cadophora sp. DSE1049]|nr:hypothetical protein DL98DRAFT_587927 [Cadophora sp. DSE1049]